MLKTLRLAVAVVPFALTLACTDAAKAPAEAAMKAAEAAVAELAGDAAKFVPDQVKAVQDAYSQAKDAMGKQDYKGALAAARDIPEKAKAALAAAATKKDALTKAWSEVSGSLPNMVAAIKSRIDVLSQSKKLPKGLEKATLDRAKEGLAAIESEWSKVSEQYNGGDMSGAIAQARGLKDKGMEIMQSLGMQQ